LLAFTVWTSTICRSWALNTGITSFLVWWPPWLLFSSGNSRSQSGY